jgi:CTP-dependent riboflavin kinase
LLEFGLVPDTEMAHMATRITGTIIRGEGNAVRNHSVLIPLLGAEFPEIARSNQSGTINVRLDQSLDKSRADIWTRRIIWQPVQRTERRLEAFGFTKVKFECPLNGPRYDCWIILPEGSSITYRVNEVEIIANVLIGSIGYGIKCAVEIDHTPLIAAPPSFGVLFGMSFD